MEMVTYLAYVLKSKFYSVQSLINTHNFYAELTLITDTVNMRYVPRSAEQLVDMRIFLIFFFLVGVGYQGTEFVFSNPKRAVPPLYPSTSRSIWNKNTVHRCSEDAIQAWLCGQTETSLCQRIQDMPESEWEADLLGGVKLLFAVVLWSLH